MRVFVLLLFLSFPFSSLGQTVDQSRGVEQRVDYAGLKAIGLWDDRNYQLTSEDLEILADNETELISPVPAFYRVLFRREYPATLSPD